MNTASSISNAPASATNVLPKGVLVAIGTLVVVSVIGTAAVRLSGVVIHEPDASVVAMRELRFEDGDDGSVVITDARTGQAAARINGEQGFLRGSLRAMARERKRSGIGAGPAFQLLARSDGRLTLFDPATQQRIDLESFGPTNAAVFSRLLPGAGTASGVATK
jgi:putative photosynthetic complex assembly protein